MTDDDIEGLSTLLEKYRVLRNVGADSYSLAVAESEIWELVSNHYGRGFTKAIGEKRDWFQTRFGGLTADYDHRAGLLRAYKWAQQMFGMVDAKELSLGQAMAAVRAARKIGDRKQIDLDIALNSYLEKTLKRRRKRQPAQEASTEVQTKAAPPVDVEEIKFSDNKTASSKEFGRYMRQLGEKFIEAQFEGLYVDGYHKKRLAHDFRISLDQLLNEFRNTVTNTKKATVDEGIEEVGEDSFNWACEVLGLTVEFGKPIDIKKVSRIQIRRARDLHPDRNPSKEAVTEYRAVNDAYTILKSYAYRQNRKAK